MQKEPRQRNNLLLEADMAPCVRTDDTEASNESVSIYYFELAIIS